MRVLRAAYHRLLSEPVRLLVREVRAKVRTASRHRLSRSRNRRRFDALNTGVPSGEIAFAPGVRYRYTETDTFRGVHEWFGWRDPESVEEMQSFLRHTQERSCLIDVGALVGTFSVVFTARTGGEAYAFEPSPGPFALLNPRAR